MLLHRAIPLLLFRNRDAVSHSPTRGKECSTESDKGKSLGRTYAKTALATIGSIMIP